MCIRDRYNGVQYGVPSGLNGPLFIWNKQIFDEAGVEYPTNDWSWDDFEKACQEIYDKTGKYGMKEPSYFLTMTMVRQAGQWFATEEGGLQDFSAALGDVSVSYTHLDVYKRQALAQSNPDLLMQIVKSIQSANTD